MSIDSDSIVSDGFDLMFVKDYNQIIEDINFSIDVSPDLSESYFIRGLAKYELQDLEGACEDLHKADELMHLDALYFIDLICK